MEVIFMSKRIGIFEWPDPNGVKMKMPGTKDIKMDKDNYLEITASDGKGPTKEREV